MGMSNAERQRGHRRRQRAYLKNLDRLVGRHADRIDRLERLLVRVLAKAELKPPLRREIERALERLRDPIDWTAPLHRSRPR
jgi:hypothetical protein